MVIKLLLVKIWIPHFLDNVKNVILLLPENVKRYIYDSVGNAIFVDAGPLNRNYDSYLTKGAWRICVQIRISVPAKVQYMKILSGICL